MLDNATRIARISTLRAVERSQAVMMRSSKDISSACWMMQQGRYVSMVRKHMAQGRLAPQPVSSKLSLMCLSIEIGGAANRRHGACLGFRMLWRKRRFKYSRSWHGDASWTPGASRALTAQVHLIMIKAAEGQRMRKQQASAVSRWVGGQRAPTCERRQQLLQHVHAHILRNIHIIGRTSPHRRWDAVHAAAIVVVVICLGNIQPFGAGAAGGAEGCNACRSG